MIHIATIFIVLFATAKASFTDVTCDKYCGSDKSCCWDSDSCMQSGSGGGGGPSDASCCEYDACHEMGSSVNWCCSPQKPVCLGGQSLCAECQFDSDCPALWPGYENLTCVTGNICGVQSCSDHGGDWECNTTGLDPNRNCSDCGAATYCKPNKGWAYGMCSPPPSPSPGPGPSPSPGPSPGKHELDLHFLDHDGNHCHQLQALDNTTSCFTKYWGAHGYQFDMFATGLCPSQFVTTDENNTICPDNVFAEIRGLNATKKK